MASKNRRALGTGAPSGTPGPRPSIDPDQLHAVADQLRELLREARGVLKDLQRERAAVEKLAATKAETVIEQRVNQCMDELNQHIETTIKVTDRETKKHFQDMLNHALGAPPDVPTLVEILEAATVLKRASVAQVLADARSGKATDLTPAEAEHVNEILEGRQWLSSHRP